MIRPLWRSLQRPTVMRRKIVQLHSVIGHRTLHLDLKADTFPHFVRVTLYGVVNNPGSASIYL